jgi:uncharacterized delta-60 repeat protein
MSNIGKTPNFTKVKLGEGSPASPEIEMDIGAVNSPKIKYNNTLGNFQYSNDGTTFNDIKPATDEVVTITANALNKTLKQAILDGDIGASAAVKTTHPFLINQSTAVTLKTLNDVPGADISYSVVKKWAYSEAPNNETSGFATTSNTSNPKFNGANLAVAYQADGKILFGGTFTSYASNSGFDRLVRINADGTLDTAFCSNAVSLSKFNNNVNVIKVQTDGKILVGGQFTDYGGFVGRSYLVRLNSDGTLDTSFNFNAADGGKFNSIIFGIQVLASGSILVGGTFTNYGGTAGRSRVIKLNSDGTLDAAFNANAVDSAKFSGTVYTFAEQSDGKILVGGNFTLYPGAALRQYCIRLNADGTTDTSFCTNAVDNGKFGGIVYAITVQTDGKILVGGAFNDYATTTGRSKLVRLNSDGTLDTPFCVNASDSFLFSNTVFKILVRSNGDVLVGGLFTSYVVSGRNYFAALTSAGLNITTGIGFTSLNSQLSGQISDIALNAAGNDIAIAGAFTDWSGFWTASYGLVFDISGFLEWSIVNNLARTNSYKFNGSIPIRGIVVQTDGKVLIGGGFSHYAGVAFRNSLIRTNADGTLDTAFCNNVAGALITGVGTVYHIALQTDGKILVCGDFSNYGGTTGRNRFVRLNSDGTVDTAFCANATDGSKFNAIVYNAVVQSDGKILVSGTFTAYGGTAGRQYLIRLNSDGTPDATFNTAVTDTSKFSGPVYAIMVYSVDGSIFLGGSFTAYGAVTGRSNLIKFSSAGVVDAAFCIAAVDGATPKFSASVNSIIQTVDNKILVGGSFTAYGATAGRQYLLKLDAAGALDTAFNTNAVDSSKVTGAIGVHCIATQSDGKIIFGFASPGATSTDYKIRRLNADGTTDALFTSSHFTITNGSVNKVYTSGNSVYIGHQPVTVGNPNNTYMYDTTYYYTNFTKMYQYLTKSAKGTIQALFSTGAAGVSTSTSAVTNTSGYDPDVTLSVTAARQIRYTSLNTPAGDSVNQIKLVVTEL